MCNNLDLSINVYISSFSIKMQTPIAIHNIAAVEKKKHRI